MRENIKRGDIFLRLGLSSFLDIISNIFYGNLNRLSLRFSLILFGIIFIGLPMIEKCYLKGWDNKLIEKLKSIKQGKIYDYIVWGSIVFVFIYGLYLFHLYY